MNSTSMNKRLQDRLDRSDIGATSQQDLAKIDHLKHCLSQIVPIVASLNNCRLRQQSQIDAMSKQIDDLKLEVAMLRGHDGLVR